MVILVNRWRLQFAEQSGAEQQAGQAADLPEIAG